MLAPVDLSNPIPTILASAEYQAMVRTFAESPSIKAALVSPDSQALLYCLIRRLQPQLAVEIGAYLGSTTEAMARAVAANGVGELHTVDPFAIKARLKMLRWPRDLRRVTRFHLQNSMAYFGRLQQLGLRADLVFVDGNHDYEFALFDIQSAARAMRPDGFIVIDNIAQPGPFMAARRFMEHAAGWRECGSSLERWNPAEPFDRHRTTIHNTDFCVLRAPATIVVRREPQCFGELPWTALSKALRLNLVGTASGRLLVQFVIRVFGDPPREVIESAEVTDRGAGPIDIPIPFPNVSEKSRRRFGSPPTAPRRSIEPWLTWDGPGELALADYPQIR